jgi:hypothetical protein
MIQTNVFKIPFIYSNYIFGFEVHLFWQFVLYSETSADQDILVYTIINSHCYGFEYHQGLWIISCEKATQLAEEMSVVLHRCLSMPEIMHRRVMALKLHSRQLTITVLVRHKPNSKCYLTFSK